MTRLRLRDDDGVTMIEMVVAMVVMMIFLAIFTGSMMLISKSEMKARAVSDTADQVNRAFLWFDKNVRYASGISSPGSTATAFYVELSNTGGGTQVCTQVRLVLATDQLQQRTWTVSCTGYTGLSGWTPLADNITNTSTPFSVASTATGSEAHQQLAVSLTSDKTGGNTAHSASSFTLTAVNSPPPDQVGTVCQEVGRP